MRKVLRSAASGALILASFSLLNLSPAGAVTVTASGTNALVCNQAVSSATNVIAYRLSGGDCVVEFRNAGTLTWTIPGSVTNISVLTVGGGGGGGGGSRGNVDGYRGAGGGGEGGEVLYDAAYSVSGLSSVSVVIGAGGSSGSANNAAAGFGSFGGSGGTSSINGAVAAAGGGGGGAMTAENQMYSGGDGGGLVGSCNTTTVQSSIGTTNNYYAGCNDFEGAGGGAGAGENGYRGSDIGGPGGNGGNGGAGISNSITTTPTVFGGGGGGGGTSGSTSSLNGTSGSGGSGGGGGGSIYGNPSPATSGTDNRGGGGGGGAGYSNGTQIATNGGSGGSGLVIVRYVPDTVAPTFTSASAFNAAENIATSANAATITASEAVSITITAGLDSALFNAVYSNSTTAWIRFNTSPNFEAPIDNGANNVYNLTLTATDTTGNTATQAIAITVTNVNEAPTITNNSSAATYAISQNENIASVLTYSATDVDSGATLSFSISGTDAADFTINSVSGVLVFSVAPNFEAPIDADINNTYIVIITVSDGSLTDTQTLTVTINNINEISSISGPTVTGALQKGVVTVITVTVNTPGKVRFFVGGKRIANCLARATSGSAPSFSATCSWRPSLSGMQILSATLTPTDTSFTTSSSAISEYFATNRTTQR